MSVSSVCDLQNGSYKSKDFISNFRIKVQLRSIATPKTSVRNDIEVSPEQELEMQPILECDDKRITVEEAVFSWQQKIFSAREVKNYSNLVYCKSALEVRYHDEVLKLTGERMPTNRLFSYVDSDGFTSTSQLAIKMTTNKNETSNYLTNGIMNLRLHNSGISELFSTPKTNIVDPYPERTKSEMRHFTSTPVQTMTIMADINDLDKLGCTCDEVVLCTIHYSPDGTVTVVPDFNSNGEPYVLKSNNQTNEFVYTLEDVSMPISEFEREEEKRVYREIYSRHLEIIDKAVGEEFDIPSPELFKIYIFGEIVSATLFGRKNLYIRYIVEIPSGWTATDDSEPLIGSTLTSVTKVVDIEEVAYFAFPFSVGLVRHANKIAEADSLPKWPVLLLEVWSQDIWDRYHVEGYGCYAIPTEPGMYEQHVSTWQPVSSSISGRLRQFYLGSQAELNDISYQAHATSLEKERPLLRLDLKTETKGIVHIKMNIVHQSLGLLESKGNLLPLRSMSNELGSLSIQSSVQAVLEAFRRARLRMLAARDGAFSLNITSSSTGASEGICGTSSDSTKSPLLKDSSDVTSLSLPSTSSSHHLRLRKLESCDVDVVPATVVSSDTIQTIPAVLRR